MTRKQRRLALIGSGLFVLAIAAVLVLTALRDSIVFFNSPTDVVEKKVAAGSRIRLGGLVQPGTLQRKDIDATFDITDGNNAIRVTYRGILPDLFREGQGVIATGRMEGEVFVASEILARHDETYMPKEVADKMGMAHKKHDVPDPQPPSSGKAP